MSQGLTLGHVLRGGLFLSWHGPRLACGRFPELEAVALGIDCPPEAAEVVLLDPPVDLDTSRTQLGEYCVEVAYREVDHELFLGRPVVRVLRERSPMCVARLREDRVPPF